MANEAFVARTWTAIVMPTPMRLKKLMRTILCKSVLAGGTAPSMGWVAITKGSSVGAVLVILAVEVVVAIVGVTGVGGTDIKAVVGNDVVVMVAVADFRMVGSTPISGARGNETLNSVWGGGFLSASKRH
uniref:Uncharacterized protein n=1 Tax=Romanomermis culicivorax TaxID=13658 RepID=A0A915HVZ8_ROMCU